MYREVNKLRVGGRIRLKSGDFMPISWQGAEAVITEAYANRMVDATVTVRGSVPVQDTFAPNEYEVI